MAPILRNGGSQSPDRWLKESRNNHSSDKFDESALKELEYYGQAVYNFDEQMGRLFDYLSNTDRKTQVYIFGDHLPALNINSEDGYLDDIWKKYNTPLYVYSNYCNISIDEKYISLNQIAPEILKNSGINHSAYFDYIYQLRENYPVIQKEFLTNREDQPLALYNEIQWDLLSGEKYLLR